VNLSHATVSFVINDRRDVAIPETTRLRVMEAAKELGYQPNRAARALVMGRTRVVGIWTPSLHSTYLSGLFLSLTDRLRKAGFDSLFCGHDAEDGSNPFGWPVDGIIYLQGSAMPDTRFRVLPVVEIGSRAPAVADWVRIDLAPGVTEAVRHLIDTGRKHVLCLADEGDVGEGSLMAAFRRAIAIAGRTADRLALANGPTRERVATLTEFLRNHRQIDAILCSSDELALIARRALDERGLDVPRDVALIGFGYVDDHELRIPSLTAIEVPLDQVAELAYELLISRMANPAQPQRVEAAATRLRMLESTGLPIPVSVHPGASAL
jgi:LacI family transcriptional regulator